MILPLIIIFFSNLISRYATGSWLSPSSFFSLAWFFFIALPMLFAPGFIINSYGLWFIALLVMSCSCGSTIATLVFNFNSEIKRNETKINYQGILTSLVLINLISLLGIILLFSFFKSNYNIIGFDNWLTVPNLVSLDRYSGSLNYPVVVKYLLYFIYPGNIIAGIIINKKEKSILYNIQCFLPLFLSIVLGLIEGSRTSFLLGSILYFSTFLGARKILYNKFFFSTYKLFGVILISICSFTALFISVQWLRQGLDAIIFDLLIKRIQVYFFGYLSAFTLWFESNENFLLFSFIPTTFAGPFNLLGLLERDLGFYAPINIGNNYSTNIFTAFRGLIIDFTWQGTIIIAFFIGAFLQFEFQKRRDTIFGGILPLSIFYSFTLYSPLISIFHYNSIFFSWMMVFVILKIYTK